MKFVFFVDDHMYEDWSNLSTARIRTPRRNLYLSKSGPKAQLSKLYKKIMKKYGFSEADVLRHDHGKDGRHDCLYFSEKILRTSKRPILNACAKEYTEFIEDPKYFNKETSYLISFIPNRCQNNICNFTLDKEIQGLSASHVFVETMGTIGLKPKQLYTKGRGVTYRKD